MLLHADAAVKAGSPLLPLAPALLQDTLLTWQWHMQMDMAMMGVEAEAAEPERDIVLTTDFSGPRAALLAHGFARL